MIRYDDPKTILTRWLSSTSPHSTTCIRISSLDIGLITSRAPNSIHFTSFYRTGRKTNRLPPCPAPPLIPFTVYQRPSAREVLPAFKGLSDSPSKALPLHRGLPERPTSICYAKKYDYQDMRESRLPASFNMAAESTFHPTDASLVKHNASKKLYRSCHFPYLKWLLPH